MPQELGPGMQQIHWQLENIVCEATEQSSEVCPPQTTHSNYMQTISHTPQHILQLKTDVKLTNIDLVIHSSYKGISHPGTQNNYIACNYTTNNYTTYNYIANNYTTNNYIANNYTTYNYTTNNYIANNYTTNNYTTNNYIANNNTTIRRNPIKCSLLIYPRTIVMMMIETASTFWTSS